jgi:gamma-glutamyltranspeptidase
MPLWRDGRGVSINRPLRFITNMRDYGMDMQQTRWIPTLFLPNEQVRMEIPQHQCVELTDIDPPQGGDATWTIGSSQAIAIHNGVLEGQATHKMA